MRHPPVLDYVVMPEHVHLLVSEPARGGLAKAIQALKLSVTVRSAQRPFWRARYHDFNDYSAKKISSARDPFDSSNRDLLPRDERQSFGPGMQVTSVTASSYPCGGRLIAHRLWGFHMGLEALAPARWDRLVREFREFGYRSGWRACFFLATSKAGRKSFDFSLFIIRSSFVEILGSWEPTDSYTRGAGNMKLKC